MPNSTRDWRPALAATLACLTLAAPGRAQKDPCGASADQWLFMVSPYVWTINTTGQAGIGNRVADIDVSFADMLRHLRMGAMLDVEARHRVFVVRGDLIYGSIQADRGLAVGPGAVDFSFGQKQWIVDFGAGFTALDGALGALDFLAGVRYWNASASLGLSTINGFTDERSRGRGWVDGTLGAIWHGTMGDHWNWRLTGDGGGGSSTTTWQVAGLLGYNFSTRYGLSLGYRYLFDNYRHEDFIYDTRLSGAVLAFNWRF